MRPILFLGAARADLRLEKAYYRKINPQLAQRFVAAVEQATESIAAHPLAMKAMELDVRRWPVAGFPHALLYRVDEPVILVLAKQDPEKWRKRARNANQVTRCSSRRRETPQAFGCFRGRRGSTTRSASVETARRYEGRLRCCAPVLYQCRSSGSWIAERLAREGG